MSTTRCRHGNTVSTTTDIYVCWRCAIEDEPEKALERIQMLEERLEDAEDGAGRLRTALNDTRGVVADKVAALMDAEKERDDLRYEVQRLRSAYASVSEVAWHNHDEAERAANVACGWAFDLGRQSVACFWCHTKLGLDDDEIRQHTRACASRQHGVGFDANGSPTP